MTNDILVNILLGLDRLIERFQNSLQNIRLKIFNLTWDLLENEEKRNKAIA